MNAPFSITDVAIIGAGFAGTAAALSLLNAGKTVVLIDKGRGPGGRSSTRRTEAGRFDHGAPFFAVTREDFTKTVETWRGHGIAAPWQGRSIALDGTGTPAVPHLPDVHVGMPSMNGILKHLGQDLEIRFGVRVETVERHDGAWRLRDEDGAIVAQSEAVIISVPSVQAVPLLQTAGASVFAVEAAAVEVAPCWTVMALLPGTTPAYEVAEVTSGPLGLAIRQDTKPGRDSTTSGHSAWVLHAAEAWATEHLEEDKDAVISPLINAFRGVGGPIGEPVFAAAHRWRYATVTKPVGKPHLWDPVKRVGACGDWLPDQGAHGGIEAAWQSGTSLAAAVLKPIKKITP